MNTPASQSNLRAWLAVALLCVVGCLNYLDRNMLLTMRQSIVAAVPMSDAQFGLLTSIFLWVYGLLSPIAGFLADRFSRSRVIIASLFVWSLVTWLTAHAHTYNELLVARALMGVSEACYIPGALALIADYHRGSTRSFATGVHMAGIMIGQMLGGVGGWLAEKRDWTLPFSVFGVVGVVYAIVLLFTLRDVPKENAPAAAKQENNVSFVAAIANLLSNPSFLILLAFWGLLGAAGWGIVGWLPTYFQERFNLSQTAAGFSSTGYLHGASFAGVLLGGFLADHWSRTNPRGRIFVPAIGLGIAACGVLVLSLTHAFPLAVAGVITYGLTRTFTDANLMPILCLISDPRYRATGYGTLNLVSCLIGGGSVYAGGMLRDAKVDLGVLYLVVVGVLIACALLLLTLKPKPMVAAEAAASPGPEITPSARA